MATDDHSSGEQRRRSVGTSTIERVALMAIHPRYADAILAGRKQVEFRKRPLANDITTVLIYATSPIQKVIGEFRIHEVVVGEPDVIWTRFGHVGVIDQESFGEYFATSATAVAIVVEEPTRYARPRALSDLQPEPAIPQSFSYLTRPARHQPDSRDRQLQTSAA